MAKPAVLVLCVLKPHCMFRACSLWHRMPWAACKKVRPRFARTRDAHCHECSWAGIIHVLGEETSVAIPDVCSCGTKPMQDAAANHHPATAYICMRGEQHGLHERTACCCAEPQPHSLDALNSKKRHKGWVRVGARGGGTRSTHMGAQGFRAQTKV